jgi:hypothetical protein
MANIVQEQSRHVHEINMQHIYTFGNNTGTSESIPHGHGGTQTIGEHVDPSIMTNNFHEQVQCVQDVTMQEQATAFVRTERSSTSTPCEYNSNHGSHVDGTGANDTEVARFSSPHVQEINMQDLSSSRSNTETFVSIHSGLNHTQTIKEEYVDLW